ncbi:hypothetical protein V1503_24510 [Bacillus sp. SCS-151]|uniref:hypothetical protein n=1 Tax=Nanhaiella sioensis TaxID=3115293 RepID=UPI0039782C0A
MTPTENSLLEDPVKIIDIFFLGDDKAPTDVMGLPEYPYTFTATVTYREEEITIERAIYGPTVLGLIEVQHGVENKPISYFKAAYRYKDRGN